MDAFALGYFDDTPSLIDRLPHTLVLVSWMLLAILAWLRGPTPYVWLCICLMVPLSFGGGMNLGAIFTAAIIFVALYFVIKHTSKDVRVKRRAEAYAAREPLERGGEPDHPPRFKFQVQWVAVHAESTAKVAATLGLKEAQPTNWARGIAWGRDYGATIEGGAQTPCFVSPEISGWVFVLLARPLITRREIESVLGPLSQAFGEAQAFVRLPGEDGVYGWDRAIDGAIVRSFSQSRSRGMRSFGEPTDIERSVLNPDQLKGPRTTPQAEQGLSPAAFAATETATLDDWPDQPLRVAEAWSLDPTNWPQTDDAPEWLGLAGYLQMQSAPVSWIKAKA